MRVLLKELEHQCGEPLNECDEISEQPLLSHVGTLTDNAITGPLRESEREVSSGNRERGQFDHSQPVDHKGSDRGGAPDGPEIVSSTQPSISISAGSAQRKALSVAIRYHDLQARFPGTSGLLLEGTSHDPTRLKNLLIGV